MSEPTGTNEPPGDPGAAAHDVDDRADLLAVRISVTRESFAELMQRFALDVGCRPVVEPTGDDSGTLLAFAPRTQIAELEAAGYRIEIGENVSEVGRQRQAEIGEGDRFVGGRSAPRGLGTKPERGSGKRGRRR